MAIASVCASRRDRSRLREVRAIHNPSALAALPTRAQSRALAADWTGAVLALGGREIGQHCRRSSHVPAFSRTAPPIATREIAQAVTVVRVLASSVPAIDRVQPMRDLGDGSAPFLDGLPHPLRHRVRVSPHSAFAVFETHPGLIELHPSGGDEDLSPRLLRALCLVGEGARLVERILRGSSRAQPTTPSAQDRISAPWPRWSGRWQGRGRCRAARRRPTGARSWSRHR